MNGLNITRRYSDGATLFGVDCKFNKDHKIAIWLDNEDVVKNHSIDGETITAHLTEDGCKFFGIK